MAVTMLIREITRPAELRQAEVPAAAPTPPRRVLLLPPEALRRLIPAPPSQRPQVPGLVPPTPPPSARPKDRISIGPPSELRSREPLILRRDEDLSSQTRRGVPDRPPGEAETTAEGRGGTPSSAQAAPPTAASPAARGPGAAPLRQPSIAESLRNLESRLGRGGGGGAVVGSGRQMGPLFFDPLGADFTAWINHFKNEVYRNWVVPQAALLGFRGHVDIEFSVGRDGALSGLRILKSSGTPALDRAAQNALLGSQFAPLPADYGPASITMQVSFFYNESPQGSS